MGVSGGSPSSTATTFRAASVAIATRVSGRRPEVRQQDDVLELEEPWMHLGLALKHVERGTATTPARSASTRRGFVDDRAAGGVDEKCRALHQVEPPFVDEMVRLRGDGQWSETTSLVASRSSSGASSVASSASTSAAATPPRIGDAHAEGPCAPRNCGADLTEADDAERLPLQAIPR